MKKLMLLMILAVIAVSLCAVIDTQAEISGYHGIVEHRDGKPWLKELWGEDMRLLLAPQSVLDTLGLALADGDSIYVEGIRDKDLMLVGKLWMESGNLNMYWLRDFDLGDIYPGGAAYKVDAQKCIGCRLCVAPCPLGAITMVKGKAVIDQEKCTECGICKDGYGKFKGCPVGAIETK
ncbi:MAG TPA: 4Fe-4S binding protein [Candidatus Syntrophosphaera sp.]|jgi:NAD-dependent dihydropyrimidine dehydrogenase PreA subunit|nr:4Fe-4S binding protein [Candidatus Syntrophosphaera sp.]